MTLLAQLLETDEHLIAVWAILQPQLMLQLYLYVLIKSVEHCCFLLVLNESDVSSDVYHIRAAHEHVYMSVLLPAEVSVKEKKSSIILKICSKLMVSFC